ncbi:MAG: glycoside hydrolase [bacterium]|nr:glycoside hydrolase [bacterium]
MIKVAILWHMHQPFYRDPYSGKMVLPWVRLHALKDYYGMVRLLKDYPGVKATYNLVPSLLVQLESYLKGGTDRFREIFKKSAADLTTEELRFLFRHFFSANYARMIRPYPRYRYLFIKRKVHKKAGENDWKKEFTLPEIRDLQVWFSLCYFDEEYKKYDPRIRGLINKGKNFTEEDKVIIEEAEQDLLGKIIPEYRRFAKTGQIELSTTPFYHPILPLLLDPQQGRAANPGLPEYSLNFNWQADAVAQLESALAYMEKTFGKRPVGIWPSEGSLSTGVLDILDKMGIKWTATDELNLSKSFKIPIERDEEQKVTNPDFLYKPYGVAGKDIRVFFRDRHLSDLVGFFYRGMAYKKAAADLLSRIKSARRYSKQKGKKENLVVPIILDGENAWEYYRRSGRNFLGEFFRLLEEDKEVETVTFSQCLDMDCEIIEQFSPGSWINGNFDIWIGDKEDRQAWRFIEDARTLYEAKKPQLSPELKEEIAELLYTAEGSDWFWWFGKENFTGDLDIFDNLFRRNLQKIYDLLEEKAPEELSIPIAATTRPRGRAAKVNML